MLDAGSGGRRGPSKGPIPLVSDPQVRACPEHRRIGRGGGGRAPPGEDLTVGGAPAASSEPAGLFPLRTSRPHVRGGLCPLLASVRLPTLEGASPRGQLGPERSRRVRAQ